MARKIATIIGATGKQGTAAIAALIQTDTYQIRAVTRNPASAAAKSLAEKGFEVVQGNLSDESSLIAAFKGSHVIYGVTDWVQHFVSDDAQTGMRKEAEHGTNIARAAQATSTLEHFIWSTLPSVYDISGGKMRAANFDGKGEVNKYIQSVPELLAKTTFLVIGWYDVNFQYPAFTPIWVPTADKYAIIGDYPADAAIITIGDVVQNLVPFIRAIVAQPGKTKNGATVIGHIEKTTFEDLLKRWARAHGKDAVFVRTEIKTVCDVWGKYGDSTEMTRFMGEYKEEEIITAKGLGIDEREFISVDESFKKLKLVDGIL